MYRSCFAFVDSLSPEKISALEISSGEEWKKNFAFKHYKETIFPDFDICVDTFDEKYDLIIADQVFEHLKWPVQAGKNVKAMLRPDGWFIITTPFLLRIHGGPIDCRRWTPRGMNYFLQECGFREDAITTSSWGNRACAKKALYRLGKKWPWSPMKNDPRFPMSVWAFAKNDD
jgi:SAM-dependent methyltransferase